MYKSIINTIRRVGFNYQKISADGNSIKVFWFNKVVNVGDLLNQYLVSKMSGKQVEWVPSNSSEEYYMAIGSILQHATDKTTVWGSGLIDGLHLPIKPPKNVLAVRGPLTRKELRNNKIPCPEIYGDPALILPEYYTPPTAKKYELGVIPHYADKQAVFLNQDFGDEVLVIDVQQENCESFINQVLSCNKIVSSSLHGIIVADAYDVPAVRVKFSNRVYGGDFKFHDYFHSIKREIKDVKLVGESTSVSDLMKMDFSYSKDINISNLMEVCPFK